MSVGRYTFRSGTRQNREVGRVREFFDSVRGTDILKEEIREMTMTMAMTILKVTYPSAYPSVFAVPTCHCWVARRLDRIHF